MDLISFLRLSAIRRQRRSRGQRAFQLVLVVWFVYWAANTIVWHAAYRPVVSLSRAAISMAVWTALWIAITPLLARWTATWVRRGRRTTDLVLIVASGLAIVVGMTASRILVAYTLGYGLPTFQHDFWTASIGLVFRWADLHVATYGAILIGTFAWHRHWFLRATEERVHAMRSQVVQSRLQFLQAQLRPHFLFNVLNTVAEQAHQAADAASSTLHQLQLLLEQASRDDHRGLIPLGEELATLRPYLELQQLRFQSLRVETEVSVEARGTLVPPFLLQPLVENAIHHGTRHLPGQGLVRINGTVSGGVLQVEVHDNGADPIPVRAPSSAGGLGLRNTRERLRQWYGAGARIDLERINGGTVARVCIPTRPADQSSGEWLDDAATDRSPHSSVGDRQLDGEGPRWGPLVHRVTRQVRWALTFASVVIVSIRIGAALHEGLSWYQGMLLPLAGVAMWYGIGPALVRMVFRLPTSGGRWKRALSVHLLLAPLLAYLSMRVPLIMLGAPDLPVFGPAPGPVNTVTLFATIYVLIVGWAEIVRLGARSREVALRHARLDAELSELQWQQASESVRPASLLRALQELRHSLIHTPHQFASELRVFVSYLRLLLNGIGAHGIPLRAELAATRALLDAAGGRLVVDVHDSVLEMLVPRSLVRDMVSGAVRRAATQPAQAPPIEWHLVAGRRGEPAGPDLDLALRCSIRLDDEELETALSEHQKRTIADPARGERIARVEVEYRDRHQIHLRIGGAGHAPPHPPENAERVLDAMARSLDPHGASRP